MKTPQQQNDEQQRSSHSTMTTMTVSFPTEIIEDILSRLPVKSILRSRSVSKPWLNLISSSSFNKLQFTRPTTTHRRTGFFISAYDYSNHKCYYLTADNEGGALTKLMTVDDGDCFFYMAGPSHLNGLMCFTSRTLKSNSRYINAHSFLVNPATRKVFQLPDMNCCSEYALFGYLYGFDQSRNEHKILLIRKVFKTEAIEFMIFCMSSNSWKTIDAEPPFVGFEWWRMSGKVTGGVCVNSVVYSLLQNIYDILAFDFVMEKFSVISLPRDIDEEYFRDYRITKIDGCLGIVLHDSERSEFRIWLLQDYEKRVWVKETIKLSNYLNDLAGKFPLSIDVNMDDEIVFCLGKVTKNGISIPVYNMKTKCFKSVQFTLDNQFASSKSVSFCNISCYVETIMPLFDNWSNTSHISYFY